VFGAVELACLGRRWLGVLGVGVALFEVAAVLTLRAHYTMDVFTGAVTALLVAGAAAKISPWCDRRPGRVDGTKTRWSGQCRLTFITAETPAGFHFRRSAGSPQCVPRRTSVCRIAGIQIQHAANRFRKSLVRVAEHDGVRSFARNLELEIFLQRVRVYDVMNEKFVPSERDLFGEPEGG